MNDSQENQWGPCPAGQIQQMVDRLQRHRQHQAFRQAAVVTACVLLLALSIAMLVNSRGSPGDLTCQQTRELAEDYLANRLSATLQRQVTEHLRTCEACRRFYDQKRASSVGVSATAPHFLVASAPSP